MAAMRSLPQCGCRRCNAFEETSHPLTGRSICLATNDRSNDQFFARRRARSLSPARLCVSLFRFMYLCPAFLAPGPSFQAPGPLRLVLGFLYYSIQLHPCLWLSVLPVFLFLVPGYGLSAYCPHMF